MRSTTCRFSSRCSSPCTFSASSLPRADTWDPPDIMDAISVDVPVNLPLKALARTVALWSAVFVVMVIICLPGLWVALNAFRLNVAILSNQPLFSAGSYTLDNFRNMFGFGQMASLPIRQYFVNSLVISCVSTLAAVVVGIAGGYAFARFEFQ